MHVTGKDYKAVKYKKGIWNALLWLWYEAYNSLPLVLLWLVLIAIQMAMMDGPFYSTPTWMLSPSRHMHGWQQVTRSTPTDILLLIYCWEPMPPAAPGTWCSCLGEDRCSLERYIVNVTSPFSTSKSQVITEFFCGTCTNTCNGN